MNLIHDLKHCGDSNGEMSAKTSNSEPSPAKMRQLGMVVKGYRDAAGLSQEALAELLQEDESYSGSRDRSQISNYERGKVLPSRGFLTAFLEAVKPRLDDKGIELEKADADHLLYIAGYISELQTDVSDLRNTVENVTIVQESLHAGVQDVKYGQERLQGGLYDLSQKVADSMSASERVKDALFKMVPPAMYVATVGYLIDALGFFRTWVSLVYLSIAIAIVAGTVILRRLRTGMSDQVGDLFFVSVFVMLSTPLLQGAFTRMDHYGFHTIPGFAGGAMPFMLAVLANLTLSLVASIIFDVLRKWLDGEKGRMSALTRALLVTIPPIAFLYTNILLFGNPGMWVFFLGSFTTLLGAFTVLVAFKDPFVRLDIRDGWMVKATFAAVLAIALSWSFWNLATYMEPSVVSSAHHNTLWSPDTNVDLLGGPTPDYFDALGYPEDEYLERVRFGSLWMGQATVAYLIIVIGYNVLTAVRSRVRNGRVNPVISV